MKDRLVPIPSTDNSPQSTVHSPQSTDKESVEPEWSILSESSGSPHEKVQSISYGRSPRRKTGTRIKLIFRVKFEKREELRFLGHLDLVRAITRAIKRANIPIIYSQGFTKRPDISFSPPLPFGITSREEYFDICFESPPHRDIKAILNFTLPEGLQVLEVSSLLEKEVSLFEKFKKCKYSFLSLPVSDKKIQEFMAKGEILVHSINIRPAVLSIVRIRNDVSLHMQIGKVKPWWVISALLGVSEDDALDFKIERIGYIGNR